MKLLSALIFTLAASAATAEIMIPTRTVRAKEIISADDITFKEGTSTGSLSEPSDVVGQEARVVLYPGRPIHPGDVGPPAIVQRNDIVTLVFFQGQLRIITEGRSLGRGAEGERVRAMNIASRTTVFGQIMADGSIEVQ